MPLPVDTKHRPSSQMDLSTTTVKTRAEPQPENHVGFMDNCLEQEVTEHAVADRLEQEVGLEDRLEHAPPPRWIFLRLP